MKRNIICFPHRLGQTKIGVEHGPALMLAHLLHKYPNYQYNILPVDCNNNPSFFHTNINNLYKMNQSLPLHESRINLGGDHSMSIATIAHSLNQNPNTKVVWVDAHADINTIDSSKTGNKHGMPLSFLTGLDNRYKKYSFIKNHLQFKNLFYVGLRDMDEFEKKILYKYNIPFITSDELNNDAPEAIYKIQQFVRVQYPVHLSIDVDVIDPNIFPHTGTISKNGANIYPLKTLLTYLLSCHNIYNIDIAEFNPFINDECSKGKLVDNVNTILSLLEPLFLKEYGKYLS
jgi:arginase